MFVFNPGVKPAPPLAAPSKIPHSPFIQRVFGSDSTGGISCAVAAENAIPFIPTQITSPPVVFFLSLPPPVPPSPSQIRYLHTVDLTCCDGSSQPGRGPGACLTHPNLSPTPWLVPDSGSLLEGTQRSLGLTMAPFTVNLASGP